MPGPSSPISLPTHAAACHIAPFLFPPDQGEVNEYITRIRGFSGCGFETIAGLKVELGLERVDLVGGNGGDDVNEGVDDGSVPGQIEGRELLDMADDGLSHVPGLEQYPFTSPCELQASDIWGQFQAFKILSETTFKSLLVTAQVALSMTDQLQAEIEKRSRYWPKYARLAR